jgi:hypothetical protein
MYRKLWLIKCVKTHHRSRFKTWGVTSRKRMKKYFMIDKRTEISLPISWSCIIIYVRHE